MSLHIEQRESEGIIILGLKGPLTSGHGLGALVGGLARLRKAGGRLAPENLNRPHAELFLPAKLAIALEFFEDAQDAVTSFFPDRALRRCDVLNFVQHEDDGNSNHGAHSAASC
jgi:hypothetical protein